MRKLTATLCLTIAVLLGSTGVSWGKKETDGLIQSVFSSFKTETQGKSVLGFTRFSSFDEITQTYVCKKYKSTGNTLFANSDGDWVTHSCTKEGKKLILQVRKNRGLSVIRGIYDQNKIEAQRDLSTIISLINKPTEYREFGDVRRNEWGKWGISDPDRNLPIYYFRIDFEKKVLGVDSGKVVYDKQNYRVIKTLVNNEKYKKYTTFDPKPIWDGVWSVIQWLLYFAIWWFTFTYHSENLPKEDLNRPRWIIRRERILTFIKIVLVCGFLAVVFGQGGQVCSSTDLFGCSEYSGEYREPWTDGEQWQYFVEILGIALLAWVMALKGYKIDGGRVSYWR